MSGADHSEETRKIYHHQHTRIANDASAMKRFVGMFSQEYFGVEKDFFSDKKVLDAGCGDTGKLLIAFYNMGCRDIHGFDLGDEFKSVARMSLEKDGVDTSIVNLESGNIVSPPYEPETFDFVACHGVMVHLNNLDEVERSFAELARLVKPHGYLYTVYGTVGGLFEEAIFPAVRKYYREDDSFKKFIDNIEPENLVELLRISEKGIKEHEGETLPLVATLRDLLDVDLCVFFSKRDSSSSTVAHRRADD